MTRNDAMTHAGSRPAATGCFSIGGLRRSLRAYWPFAVSFIVISPGPGDRRAFALGARHLVKGCRFETLMAALADKSARAKREQVRALQRGVPGQSAKGFAHSKGVCLGKARPWVAHSKGVLPRQSANKFAHSKGVLPGQSANKFAHSKGYCNLSRRHGVDENRGV